MIRLQLLGEIRLDADNGAEIPAIVQQPKRLALLAYLAASDRAAHRRDHLIGLFWAEQTQSSARHALSQALYNLRQGLGNALILNRGAEEIGLAPDAIACDVAELRAAIAAGRFSDVVALYRGPLMPGFFVSEAPAFEEWLDAQRAELDAAVVECALRHATSALPSNPRAAAEAARFALRVAPLEERALRLLMQSMSAAGERAGALQAFDAFAAGLRAELEIEPSPETVELAATLREEQPSVARRDVPRIPAAVLQEPVAAPVYVPPQRRVRPRRATAFAVAAVALVLVVSGWLTSRAARGASEPATAPQPNRIAVLYFKDNSGTVESADIARGLTTSLINRLGTIRQLRVLSQNGADEIARTNVPIDSIGTRFNVGSIVEGRVEMSSGRVRVYVSLLDARTGTSLHSHRIERPVTELFRLEDDVSEDVAAFLRTQLGEEIRLGQLASKAGDARAWQALQRASVLSDRARQSERRGDYDAMRRDLLRADSLLQYASRIDPRWNEPVLERGNIAGRLAWMPDNTVEARLRWMRIGQALAEAAVRAEPQNAAAHELRGVLRYWEWLVAPPKGTAADVLLTQAEEDLEKAVEIEPGRPRGESNLSAVLFAKGEFPRARLAALRALDADAYLTDSNEIVSRLFLTSFEMGDDVEASRWCNEIGRRLGDSWPAAFCSLTMLGWSKAGDHDPRKALHMLETASSMDPPDLRAAMRPRLMVLTAGVLARAGRKPEADSLLAAARASGAMDNEIYNLEAGVRVLLGEEQRALELLAHYLKGNPTARMRIARSRMLAPLRSSQPFRNLLAPAVSAMTQGQTIIPLT